MNLRSFRILIEVCKELNMTRAAKNLHMSQPSVSQCIKELEEHYGVLVFERLSRRLYLTREGRVLLSYAQHFITLDLELTERMSQLEVNQTFSVGATVSIGTYVLPRMIRDFQFLNPHILLKTLINNTQIIEERIINSQIDLGIVEGTIVSPEIVVRPFYVDHLVIVASSKSPLVGRKLRSADLQDLHFLIREEGSGSRKLFLETLEHAGFRVEIIGEYNNSEAIINGVKKEIGLGVVSKLAVNPEDKEVSILDVEDLHLPRPFSLAYHKNKYISDGLKSLIEFVLGE